MRKIALPYPHKCLFGFVEQNVSTDKNFLRNILVTRGDPLSAHVRACAVVVVDRRMSRALHLYFWSIWEQHVFFLIIVHSRMKIYEVLKRASVHLPVVVHYLTGTTTNSASLVLKRVRIRCPRRCCCKVFSGRRCISSAVLAHYSTGTTSLSMKGMQRRFCCKVFSGKLLYGPLFDGKP